MYDHGQGGPQDVKQAYAWFSVSAASGYGNKAAEYRDRAAKQLTPAALAEAQALADRYIQQHSSQS
ncbi:hypothetical protein ACSZNE_03135 [Aeromonas caviae]